MILLWGAELVQLYNDGYVPLLGAKHPTALGQPTQACWPEVWDLNAPIYARVRAGETVTREDACYPVRRGGPDGPAEDLYEDRYVTISYSPVPDESGAVGGVLVTAVDTTAAVRGRVVQAEEARREAEARAATLAAVIDSIPDAVLVVGPEGVTLANPAALDQLGVPTVEALRTATPPEALPLAAELLDRATGAPVAPEALPLGRALRGERSHAHLLLRAAGPAGADGVAGARPVRAAAAPILGPDGAILGAVAILTDMTRLQTAVAERDRLLAERAGERALLHTVLEQMPAAVFIVEAPSGRSLAMNDAVARIWGEPRPHSEAASQYSDAWVGYHPDGRRVASAEWPLARAALVGETVTDWVGEIERTDGTRATIEVSAAPVRDAAGRTVAAVAVVADITARAQAARERERLLRSSRSSAPGSPPSSSTRPPSWPCSAAPRTSSRW
jgi:PAS domain S-box-containing protein